MVKEDSDSSPSFWKFIYYAHWYCNFFRKISYLCAHGRSIWSIYCIFFYLKRKQPFFPDLLKYIFFFVKSLKASEFEAQQIENLPWNPTIIHYGFNRDRCFHESGAFLFLFLLFYLFAFDSFALFQFYICICIYLCMYKMILIFKSISFFFKFYFIFKVYKIVLVLPNIKMNPPQVTFIICTRLEQKYEQQQS